MDKRPLRRPRKNEKKKRRRNGTKNVSYTHTSLFSSSHAFSHLTNRILHLCVSFYKILPCFSSLQWTNLGRGILILLFPFVSSNRLGCYSFSLLFYSLFHPIPNSPPVIPTSPHRSSWLFLPCYHQQINLLQLSEGQ